MIVGCYSMDLYCENAHVYTGETWGECVRDARRDGWKITPDRKAYCPNCSGKKKGK